MGAAAKIKKLAAKKREAGGKEVRRYHDGGTIAIQMSGIIVTGRSPFGNGNNILLFFANGGGFR